MDEWKLLLAAPLDVEIHDPVTLAAHVAPATWQSVSVKKGDANNTFDCRLFISKTNWILKNHYVYNRYRMI